MLQRRPVTVEAKGHSMIEIGLADFERGAQLETSGKRSADVSKALSRIQGPTRIAIERIRAKARFAAKGLQADAIQQSGAARMLNGAAQPAPASVDPFTGDRGLTGGEPRPMPTPCDAPANASGSPFDNSPAPDASTPSSEPTMPAPGTSNPFGDDPAPAPAAPSDNPFGT